MTCLLINSRRTDTRTTTTAKHYIAAIGLNAYRLERSCHDLIILSLSGRRCASWQWVAVLRMFIVLQLERWRLALAVLK